MTELQNNSIQKTEFQFSDSQNVRITDLQNCIRSTSTVIQKK